MGDLPVVVIAAAGRSERFGGEQKVLAPVAGVPSVCRVARACEEGLGPQRQLVVIGHQGHRVRAALGTAPHRQFVYQHPQLGTGHALALAIEHLERGLDCHIYFFCGDKPLLTARSVRRLRANFLASGAAMAFLTGTIDGDPGANRQGRVLRIGRGGHGAEVIAIAERSAMDALGNGQSMAFRSQTGRRRLYTRDQLLARREVNVSAYVWHLEVLRQHIAQLRPDQRTGEYLLTDLANILHRQGLPVRAFPICSMQESVGIDTRQLLKEANNNAGRGR